MGRKREYLKQIVNIGEDIRIAKVDAMNWIVQEKWYNKEKHVHEWSNRSYHANPAQAMRTIVNNMPIDEGLELDLNQFQQWYHDRISRLERQVLDAVGR